MDQTQAFVEELASLVGVQEVFLFDDQGRIRLRSSTINLKGEQAQALARILTRTLTGLSTVQRSDLVDIDLAYNEGRVVVKGLPKGGMCILCDRQMNYALLNITLEQGLNRLRERSLAGSTSRTVQKVEQLKEIAREMLGSHADKVINILDTADENDEAFLSAITQAEKVTRMFIDKTIAGEMAFRMREVIQKSD